MDIVLTKDLLGDEEEADLVEWLVEDGDAVRAGQPIASLETSKLVNEIEAPATGVITIRKAAGELVERDEVIASIEERDD